MAGDKRRHRDDEDEDDEVSIDGASSSLRQDSRKRPRIKLSNHNDGSVASEDDSDLHDLTRHDQDSENDDEVEIDEFQASQFVKRQFQQHKENREVENGIIEEVRCENFMCHEKLTVKLGPLINFIIGHNGSGKSAVLTALTVCLGGKATNTNRGTSLKSMIKEGKEQAILSVRIKNQGEDAYRPDLYGRSIVVERHFSMSGKSAFRLKNAQGKVITKMKRDMDDIIDYFALQLDNPINVLNQDMARQFLSNSSASDKYKFFIRGTQLETLDADYKLLEETLDSLQGRLDSRVDDLRLLEAASNEAEAGKKRLEASDSFREEIRKTQRMHAWAQVEEQEQLLEKYNEKVVHAEARVGEAEHAAETAGGVFEGAEQATIRAQQRVTELESDTSAAVKHGAIQQQFDAGRSKLGDLLADYRIAKGELKSERDKKAKLQQQIQAERDLLGDVNGSERASRLDQIEKLKEAHRQAEEDSKSHETHLPSLEASVPAAYGRFKAAEDAAMLARSKVEQEQLEVTKLESELNQRYAGFRQHRNMERLVNMVEQDRRFRAKPIGPLGLHIKLKEFKWMGLIEKYLSGSLDSFVVTSEEDKDLLRTLMSRADCQTTILIGRPQHIDTSRHEPDEGLTTILRVLDIENELVRNQLIIGNNAEQAVLFPDLNQANNFFNRGRPPNVKAVLAWTNSGRGDGARLDWTRSGGKRSGPLAAHTGPSRMQANHDDQIARQREVVQRVKSDLHRHEQEKQRLRKEHETAKQLVEKHKRTRAEHVTRIQRISDEIERVQEEIEKNQPKDGRLQELERQLDETVTNEQTQHNITGELAVQKAQVDEDQKQLKTQLDAATAKVQAHQQSLTGAKEESAQYASRRTQALLEKNKAYQAISDRKEELKDRIHDRDMQQENLETNFIREALQVCPRIPVDEGMTPAKLDDKLTRFQRDVERAERDAGGTIEELTNAWKKHKTAWMNARTEYNGMKELGNTLLRSLSTRKERWRKFRQFISLRARASFIYLLSERAFRGRIILDHTRKLLDLAVEPDLTRKSNAGREARTLSGGEKSFSTVCLLLSIWEAMGSPIRCLDEFDVFMDSVNRATSMKLMIEAARRAVGRQFILITPQSMQAVDLSTDVAIYKMPDPERGQQALPFTQTA